MSAYDKDGLHSVHNHEFMDDPRFIRAYARGVKATGIDYNWHWRVHTGLWAATHAARLEGDFIEFGVAKGFLSSSIMTFLDWDKRGKTFYLCDTFYGLDQKYVSAEELSDGAMKKNQHLIDIGLYSVDAKAVTENFAEWKNARVVPGPVPETLAQLPADARFAFAHIDMNCAPPEVAAATYLWDRLSDGGMILLDDYAYAGYRHQKVAMDKFAKSKNVSVLSLPTGQGLIVRPPR